MHDAWFASMLLLMPSILLADEMTTTATIPYPPPPHQPSRFNENYSYLTNQANRTDLADPLKYIPLRRDDRLWYLTIGGELRERDDDRSVVEAIGPREELGVSPSRERVPIPSDYGTHQGFEATFLEEKAAGQRRPAGFHQTRKTQKTKKENKRALC